MSQWKPSLYRYRSLLSGLLLLVIIYFVAFTWLTLPSFIMAVGWHPDTELTVLQVVEDSYGAYVQPGDVVLAIDGQPARRGQRLFSFPVKLVYEVELERDGQQLTQRIVVNESQFFRIWVVSQVMLALAMWVVGFIMVKFASPKQMLAVYAGLGFQLIAAGIVSPGPANFGAPGAWLVANVMIFYFPGIMLYLSLVPRQSPLSTSTRTMLRAAFYGLTGLALLAAAEILFLFPERSLADYLHVRSLTILTLLTGAGLLLSVIILVVRLLRQPPRSYGRQQLKLLLVFMTLAITPLFLFVILPVDQTRLFAPFPFIYSFFLLAPVGYFFVFHRQGYLALDAFFSRVITVAVLILAVVMAYATGIYFLNTLLNVALGDVSEGIFVLLLFGLATVSQRPVQTYVDLLVYGQDLLTEEMVQEIKAQLSANPEPATVTAILEQISRSTQINETVLLKKERAGYGFLAGTAAPLAIGPGHWEKGVYLRSRDADALARFPEWVELSLPIVARGDVLGLLLLSRPANGFFNGRQVDVLCNIADTMAFGLLVINLVETMQHLSQQALIEKERQRHQIATEIHNEPMHTLTALIMHLQVNGDGGPVIQNTVQTISEVVGDLRRIVSGLRPPVLRESIEWIARHRIREFEETHCHLNVSLQVDTPGQHQASETTKVAFYYIMTEALNNISKHAQAGNVDICLYYGQENLELTICDDGVGPGIARQPLTQMLRQQHLGIADMHRWASVASGRLIIAAQQPTGTTVRLILPIDTAQGISIPGS
jgi:signal transduction histidine kinase